MTKEELENLRIKVRNKILLGGAISIVLAIIIGLSIGQYQYIFIVFIFGIAITMILTKKSQREFNLAFKDLFVLKSLKDVFTDLTYEPEKGFDEYLIAQTGMMDMGDRYSSNDYIKGKYKNINVEQADVHIEREEQTTDENGNTQTTYVTIFRGRWMVFDFNKMFKANIQIKDKRFSNSRLWRKKGEEKYKKVQMEDEEFNKKFKVFAQSEHDAFYVLTPSLMEKIQKLKDGIKGTLLLCLIDNKLHVAVQNNKDSFEHSVFKKIEEEKILVEISSDIKLITNFVDELNLDNDLFKKGGIV